MGTSTTGKTTAQNWGLSVWGKPKNLRHNWHGAKVGFELTAAHSDAVLMLDEIGQADLFEVGDLIQNTTKIICYKLYLTQVATFNRLENEVDAAHNDKQRDLQLETGGGDGMNMLGKETLNQTAGRFHRFAGG